MNFVLNASIMGLFSVRIRKQAIYSRSNDPLLYLKLSREMSRGSLVIMTYDVFDQWYKKKGSSEKGYGRENPLFIGIKEKILSICLLC